MVISNTNNSSRIRYIRHKNSGFVLISVIVTISILAAIALIINRDASMGTNLSKSAAQSSTNNNVTHAVLQHAMWQINNNSCISQTDLVSNSFGADSYQASITTNGSGVITTYTVPILDDTYIDQKFPSTNYGSNSTLIANTQNVQSKHPLYRFDFSAIPAGTTVISASAYFYVITPDPDSPMGLHLITANWSENDATWNNMSTNYETVTLDTIEQNPPASAFVTKDFTHITQAWINGKPNLGIMLIPKSNNNQSLYSSKEYGSPALRPYIEVVTTSGTIPSRATINATSTMANGITQTLTRSNIPLYQDAINVNLQLDTGSGKDTTLSSLNNTQNYGDDVLGISASGSADNALLQFDDSDIPYGVRIISAQLELYHTVTSSVSVDDTITVHSMRSDWVEGTMSGAGIADGATWDTRDGITNWTSGGADYDPQPITSSAISGATGDWESWDITTLVQGWFNGSYPRYGLLLQGNGTSCFRAMAPLTSILRRKKMVIPRYTPNSTSPTAANVIRSALLLKTRATCCLSSLIPTLAAKMQASNLFSNNGAIR